MGQPIICIDFDGVLHSYTSDWKGAAVAADPPVPGAIEWLETLCRGRAVQPMIYSSRSLDPAGVECMRDWLRVWGLSPDALAYIQFPTQKPPAFVTIDDRAICFEGTFPRLAEILHFRPWNKQHKIQVTAKSKLEIEALIDDLRQLEKKATPGPWRYSEPPGGGYPYIQSQHVRHVNNMGDWADVARVSANNYDNEPNAEFIVAVRNALPQLLHELKICSSTEQLLAAAKQVLAGLNARIDEAPADAIPVFDGIADLHAAIVQAEARS